MNSALMIQPGDIIQTDLLNNTLQGLYSYINSINYTTVSGSPMATTGTSGAIIFTNSISTSSISGLSPAISPSTLAQNIENAPMVLNTFYNNNIASVSYLNASMQYILLPNKIVMMFGQCTPINYSITIYLAQLFALTPYTLASLYFINIGGGETLPEISSSMTLIYASKDVIITGTGITMSAYEPSQFSWFALGKIN